MFFYKKKRIWRILFFTLLHQLPRSCFKIIPPYSVWQVHNISNVLKIIPHYRVVEPHQLQVLKIIPPYTLVDQRMCFVGVYSIQYVVLQLTVFLLLLSLYYFLCIQHILDQLSRIRVSNTVFIISQYMIFFYQDIKCTIFWKTKCSSMNKTMLPYNPTISFDSFVRYISQSTYSCRPTFLILYSCPRHVILWKFFMYDKIHP